MRLAFHLLVCLLFLDPNLDLLAMINSNAFLCNVYYRVSALKVSVAGTCGPLIVIVKMCSSGVKVPARPSDWAGAHRGEDEAGKSQTALEPPDRQKKILFVHVEAIELKRTLKMDTCKPRPQKRKP